MTAPLLSLPISAPAASGGGQPAAGAAGAMGFEALMAAFFATGDSEAGGSLLGEGEKVEDTSDADVVATDGAPTTPMDAQTLAALLAVTPQATPAPTTATEAGDAPQGQAGAPPVAFSPLLAQEIASATPAANAASAAADAGANAAVAANAAALPVETPETDAPDATLAAAPAQDDSKTDGPVTPQPQGLDKPRETQAAPTSEHAQAKAAPTPAAQPAPQSAQAETAADPAVQAQVAATEVEVPAEPVKDQGPAKSNKTENGRRNAGTTAHGTTAPAAPANDAAPVVAPVAADADSASDAVSAIEGEAVAAVTTREAKPQTADAPDGQGPANTAAASQNAAGPIIDAPLPARGSPETVAHLAAQIVKKLEGRSTHFDVELNPAGLGQVTVSVEIGAQGKMTAALQFESAQAANELRHRAPELQKALEQAGFDLSGGGLSFDVAGDRGQGQGRGDLYQQQQQNDGGAWRGRAFQAVLDTADGAAEAAAAAALHLQRRANTGVDVRV